MNSQAVVRHLKDPVCIIAFAQAFIQCVHLSFFPYFALFLKNHEYSIETITSLIFFREAMKLPGILLGGICSDLRHFKTYTILSFLLSSIGYFLIALTDSPSLLFLSFGLIGFFYGFAYLGENNLIIHFKNTWDLRIIYSLIKTCMGLGALIAPIIGTLFVSSHPKRIAVASGVFFILYSLVIAFLIPKATKEPISKDEISGGYLPILKDIPFIQFILCLLVISICTSVLFTSLPIYLGEHFANGVDIYSAVISINSLIVIAMHLFMNKFLQNLKTTDLIFYGITLYSFVFLLLSFLNHSAFAIIILFSLFTLVELVVMPNAYSMVIQIAKERNVGKYQAIANLRFFLAAPASSLFAKFFVGYRFLYFFAYFLLTLFVLPFFYFLKRKRASATFS